MAELPPDVADPLYALPPSEFVAARGQLAKQLRADGDKAAAAVVAKLRRPTPVAGALNRLVREQPALVEAAVAAGTALQAATDAALGGDASALRSATADDRAATRSLSEAVAAVLGAAPSDVASRVTATVRAAVASPDVAATLEAGRLDADHEPTGFGLTADADGSAVEGPPVDELAPRRQARADKAERQRQEQEAEERRARTRRRAAHEKEVARLQAKAERLVVVAREAEQAAADARAAADAAAEELAAAQAEDPERPSG